MIGTAFALNMLFNIPIWIGVLLTGLSTLMLLALQQYGVTQYVSYVPCFFEIFGFHSSSINDHIQIFFCLQVRKLEFFIAFLVLTIAGCFFAELGYAKPAATEVLDGLFIPKLKGNGATGLAISLLGAMVMPYVSSDFIYQFGFLSVYFSLLTVVGLIYLLQAQSLPSLCIGAF